MKRLTPSRAFLLLAVAACSSSLGKLGVIDDDDAGVDAGRSTPDASDAPIDAPVDIIDASPDVETGPMRGSPEGGRPTALACENIARPAGQPRDAGGCQTDNECDAGSDGRCDLRRFNDGGSVNVCTYPRCATDSNCTGTAACGCGVGSLSRQNLCLSNSNCRIDGDCASGERCVYSAPIVLGVGNVVFEGNEVGGTNYSGQALGYFCTTPSDACRQGDRPDGTAVACTYNQEAKRWQWATGP